MGSIIKNNKKIYSNGNQAAAPSVNDITGLGTGVATFLSTPSSTNLASAITDETGTAGSLVFSNAPALTNPTATTQSANDNSTKVATTAYVDGSAGNRIVATSYNGSVTGTLTETVIATYLIPSLSAKSVLEFFMQNTKTGTAASCTLRMYYNTTADLSGSPVQIGLSTFGSGNLYCPFYRRICNENSTTANHIFKSTVSSTDDYTANASAMTNIGVDLSGKYIIISMALGNTGDTFTVTNSQLYHNKP